MESMKPTAEDQILVSVWMPVYYSGDTIAQSIDSILMQETEYPYEIVINDDCSGDNTWEVISEYAAKYPDIIRAIRNEKNLGLSANVLATKLRCKGKYIVNLSGGDYWIDKHKIQKQVEFLENHPDYVGVGSKVELRYDNEQVAFSSYPSEYILGKNYTIAAYNANINLPSHGLMIRNIFADPANKPIIDRVYSVSSAIDDLYDPVLYLQFGKIYIMREATCVYRNVSSKKGRHNFNSSKKPFEKAMIIFQGYNSLETLGIPGVDLQMRFNSVYRLLTLDCLAHLKFITLWKIYRSIPDRYRKKVGKISRKHLWSTACKVLKNRMRRLKISRSNQGGK